MAKNIKFALEMREQKKVRYIEDFSESFDMGRIVEYFQNGKLRQWLKDRKYIEALKIIDDLNLSDNNFKERLATALGVNYDDIKDNTAFDQKELDKLITSDIGVIYLCQNHFVLPADKENITYRGLGDVTISFTKLIMPKYKEIRLENIKVGKEYQKRIDDNPEVFYIWAQKAHQARNISEEERNLKEAVRRGHVQAMLSLGDLWSNEKNEDNHYDMALAWYQKAAKSGLAQGYTKVGKLYDMKKCKGATRAVVFDWYRRGAVSGDTDAMLEIAIMYAKGSGTTRNYGKAKKWCKKASDGGNVNAQCI